MNNYFSLRKRGLALFVALMMCLSMLPGTAMAADKDKGDLCPECKNNVITYVQSGDAHRAYCGWGGCTYDKTEDHDFSNGVSCTKCGASAPIVADCQHEKTYVKDNGDGKTHSVYCTSCEKQVSTVSHSFTNGKCDCGAQEPVHTHSWTYSMYDRNDRFTHKAYCSCGATKEEACTTSEVFEWGQKVIKCSLCGYWEPAEDQHNWSDWEPDGNGKHVRTCTDAGCTASGEEECKLEVTADGTAVKCTVCGYVKYNDGTGGSDKHEHKVNDVWYAHTDDGGYCHVKVCVSCKEIVERERCNMQDTYNVDGKLVAAICSTCENRIDYVQDNGCNQGAGVAHEYETIGKVQLEDGKYYSLLRCTACGIQTTGKICDTVNGDKEKEYYRLTVKYVDDKGEEVFPTETKLHPAGTNVGFEPPAKDGYTVSPDKVNVVMDKDQTVTVTYTKVDTLTYTVRWCDVDTGKELKDAVSREGAKGTWVKPTDADKVINGYKYVADDSDDNGFLLDSGSVEIKLCFKKNPELISYTVEWQVNGKTEKTETRYAYEGEKVGPTDKDKVWEGYTYLPDMSDNEEQDINPEGTTHIKLVFNKNVVEPTEVTYTVTLYDATNNTVIKTMTRNAEKVGADIRVEEGDKNVSGYIFLTGDDRNVEFLENIPATGAELKLFFVKENEESVNIKYTVTWIGVAADGTEKTLATENREVTDMDATSVSVTEEDMGKTFNGYVFDASNSRNVLQVEDVKGQTDVQLKLYFTQVPDPAPETYKVTIHYVYENGDEAAPDYERDHENGTYPISSPLIEGYTPDELVVNVVVNGEDVTVTVTYTANANTPGEDPDPEQPDPEQPSDPDDPTPDDPTVPTPPTTIIPPVDTPLGGGVTGAVTGVDTATIVDEETPLAGTVGLDTTNHFAYIIGYDDGTVRPLANITRAEAVTIFFRLMTDEYRNANWSTANSFADVNAGDWYNNAISTCQKAGALEPFSQNASFLPDQAITRAEFAALAAGFIEDTYTGETVGDFSDTEGHWAAEYIRKAVEAGWITGSGNAFRPDELITRADVMTMVNRMLDRVPDAEHMLPTMKTWTDNPEGTWYYEAVQEATNEHAYERDEMGIVETWTALLEVRDWAALEEEWAENNNETPAVPETDGGDE